MMLLLFSTTVQLLTIADNSANYQFIILLLFSTVLFSLFRIIAPRQGE